MSSRACLGGAGDVGSLVLRCLTVRGAIASTSQRSFLSPSSRPSSAGEAILRLFALIYVVALLFNAALLEAFCRLLHLGELLGGALCLPAVAVLTFFLMKRFVFRQAVCAGAADTQRNCTPSTR